LLKINYKVIFVLKEKIVILTIKGKEYELALEDFPIPIKVKDKLTGKSDPESKRILDARIKDGQIKIRCN